MRNRKVSLSLCAFLIAISFLFVQACGQEKDSEVVDAVLILNVDSKKIHKENCPSVKRMLDENKREYSGNVDILFKNGYTTCGNCFQQN